MPQAVISGSGTSAGLPVLGCECNVCSSSSTFDKRLRASLLLQHNGFNYCVDTGPDFRAQMLIHNIGQLHGILLTHHHYDHMAGLDDVKPYSIRAGHEMTCYLSQQTYDDIKNRIPYMTTEPRPANVTRLAFTVIDENKKMSEPLPAFYLDPDKQIQVQPVRMWHVLPDKLMTLGFIFNNKFAYLTDFRKIHDADKAMLNDLETIVLGSPLPVKHPTHISHYEAIDLFKELGAQKAYLTHLSHSMTHQELSEFLPDGFEPAYDGLKIEF